MCSRNIPSIIPKFKEEYIRSNRKKNQEDIAKNDDLGNILEESRSKKRKILKIE